ncbi:YaaL family protein [Virgibacillus sp. W0181]|uniref:YaaL family protein n=1 Tax=Virgibacillus sp. W0181 TaxID=3391581 RepID=UPI003F483DB8
MSKKVKKTDVDKQLLYAIITVEAEWKKMQSIIDQSIDPVDSSLHRVSFEQAKYMFLLREARHRKVSAIRY